MRVAIAGAGSGIGAATAQWFQDQGATIVGLDAYHAGDYANRWIIVDFDDPDSIAAAVKRSDGRYDALINCIDLDAPVGSPESILATNYFGSVMLVTAFTDSVKQGGSIVNLTSSKGSRWRKNIEQVKSLMALSGPDALEAFLKTRDLSAERAYALSKEAMIAWTYAQCRGMTLRGLRINAVSTTETESELSGCPPSSNEIARVIAFLADRQSAGVNGLEIAVDGGISAVTQADSLSLKS